MDPLTVNFLPRYVVPFLEDGCGRTGSIGSSPPLDFLNQAIAERLLQAVVSVPIRYRLSENKSTNQLSI
jgi:hypothetical protein